MEAFLMTGQAARLLQRSEQSVRIYVEAGRLPAMKTANGKLLFRESDVLKLAAEFEQKTSTEAA